jgi:DhnA family fructose-bisphosphate aldolase class Ia
MTMKLELIAEELHAHLAPALGTDLVTVGYTETPRKVLYVYTRRPTALIPKRFKQVAVVVAVTGKVKPAAAS